jgi:hypothetical protein
MRNNSAEEVCLATAPQTSSADLNFLEVIAEEERLPAFANAPVILNSMRDQNDRWKDHHE